MKKAFVPALLLVLGSVVLGATVFPEQLARAAPGIQDVFVTNSTREPVPVHEQGTADVNVTNAPDVNVTNAPLAVHEQGTSDVNVTNTSLPVAPPQPITGGGGAVALSACPNEFSLGPMTASAIRIEWSNSIAGVTLRRGNGTVATFGRASGADGSSVDLALTRPITFDEIRCFGAGQITVSWVGNDP